MSQSFRTQSYRDEAYRKAAHYQHTVYGDDGKFRLRGFFQAAYGEIGKPGKYFLYAGGVWFLWHQFTKWACQAHASGVDTLKENEEKSFRESGTPVKGEEYIVRNWEVTSESTDDIASIPLFTRSRIRNPLIKYKELDGVED
ncbi:multi-sensor signal transduction histidine kinase [Perkinsela sp. CCAP 1560/4]|nr:multi-sensor signal transduction histidine kinase [Perkinsela sp. CCAP 1560/4]|eukprot:KNH07370.1 multi-sensor signal transduction histidine kinase [Perkinsela sp. CCAP 1560/4]